MSRSLFRIRLFVILGVALILAVAAYGFAAANTVPGSGAGDGQGTISGYTIGNVKYTLDANPLNIASVSFTVAPDVATNPAPTTVKAKLVSSGTSYFDCTNPSGTTWSCPVTGVTVLAANELRVIAAQ